MIDNKSIRGRLVARLLVSMTIFMVIEARSIVEEARKGPLDPREVSRLNNMFTSSVNQALKGMFEANAMNAIEQAAIAQSKNISAGDLARSSGTMVRIRPYLIVADHSKAAPLMDGSKQNDENSKKEEDQIAEHLVKSGQHDKHPHSDARQSAFWPQLRPSLPGIGGGGYGSPSYGGAPGYPNLMGGLQQMRPPSLPNFHMFPGAGGSQPRPKTSVIGNGGGPMALTNDNVVVVNVLSSNF